ncbi:predicted protein [Paecilomyces variotii No. 5]|uniref:Protein kinase domain-containing protein n=1 Tax=Byssochlamys spectabilis (strain No. 5 / NBRC 109023) TaxID=1356009 RepID=V5G9N8_BYSSN|nr:predicted protein [Paecilomyces variotii No. 5]
MASSSFSGRAVTSVMPSSDNSESTQQTTAEVHSSIDPRPDGTFVPHIYDFVSIHKPAVFRGSSRVPPLYLEPLAVDQSIIVGHGASFTAFRRAIPEAPELSHTSIMDGWSVIIPQQESRPKHVVYKVARVAFTDTGIPSPSTRRAMKAALMELYCLVHEPIRKHPNIIDLLGLAWGSNYFEPSHRLPVLVVEYADHGNLADLQKRHDLAPHIRRNLAIDIGQGLEHLHRCGIIHGDVKSENILVFSHPEREYIAKLSDFGFSVVGEAADAEICIGGTRPWRAPETKSPVPRHLLRATDVYSYGMLLWRLATDGHDPFRFWAPLNLRGEHYLQELEKIKEDDHPAKNTSLDKWLIQYISAKYQDHQAELSIEWLSQTLTNLQLAVDIKEVQGDQSTSAITWEAAMKSIGPILRFPETSTMFSGPLLERARRDIFYGRVPPALDKCLSVDPPKRDLRSAIALLAGDKQEHQETPNLTDITLHMSYDHHILSWQQMRTLPPAVQSFVFNSFYAKVENLISNNLINPPDCFVLASYYINGYGTDINYKEAKRLIDLSSNKDYDHVSSRAYAYRIHKALDPNYAPTQAVYDNLSVMAIRGSRAALSDLKEVAPKQYAWSENVIRDILAGVGANFFHENQMLGGFSYHQWVRTLERQDIVVRNLSGLNQIAEYKVNKRGDRILHLAASAGQAQAIKTLLGAFPSLKVDQKNDKGETPLLCACRAGQVATILMLVELGADASMTATNGETCVHWLVSIKDEDINTAGEALIKGGAGLRGFTRERIAYSEFHATIDADFQFPGTPLTWAIHNDRPYIVQFLLEKAPDTSICFDWDKDRLGPSSPLEYAAYYHHIECLELLMDALDKAKLVYIMGPIIYAAAHAADTFSMILRNGARYEELLRRTLNLCLEKSKNVVFATGIGGFDTSLLYFAVSEGHDKVVEHLLSDEVKQLIESSNPQPVEARSPPGAYNLSDINRPAEEDRRTPVLEAIRWNRKPIVELLVTNGADLKAMAKNPFDPDKLNWTAFHILAIAGHNTNYADLVSYLVDAGLPIDGYFSNDEDDSGNHSAETPFLVAVQHNALNLASTFLQLGADLNALRFSSGLLSLEYPTTPLGHIVAASAQHSTPRLRYLLEKCCTHDNIEFIVEPKRQLSALHRAAWAHKGVMHRKPTNPESAFLTRDEYDMVINRDTMQELLEKWGGEENVNLRCGIHGRTALHLAAEAGNANGVELLMEKKADVSICDNLGLSAVELAQEMLDGLNEDGEEQRTYAEIISMLLKE